MATSMAAILFVLMLALLFYLGTCLPVVHVIPHSHCDAGYRESFMGYYEGSVRGILDTMLDALEENTTRKFVWEESSFLSTWWNDNRTSVEQKVLMKKLIEEKRLEMIGGGWTMHDEADNDAATILKQMTLGLNFLNSSLNVRPKYEWHIDPFGHSIMMPELYSTLGYRAVVLNRIPDPIKQQMRKDKSLEFTWFSSNSGAEIFTHVLDMHYGTPKIAGNTTAEKAKYLSMVCNKRLGWYRTDNLLLPFGGDFNFHNASEQFGDMEPLMEYINQHPDEFGLKVQFSTLDDYFSAVISAPESTFPKRTDVDFFPYIACYPCFSQVCSACYSSKCDQYSSSDVPCGLQTPGGYWSGYYTSKPAQKLLTTEHEATISALDALSIYDPSSVTNSEVFVTGHEVQALMTHHDAITGTSFPPAYNDYNLRLNHSLDLERKSISSIQQGLLCSHANVSFNLTPSALSNLDDSNTGVISIFNPLMRKRFEYAQVELPEGLCVEVINSSRHLQSSQKVGTTLYIPVTIGPLELMVLFLHKIDCQSQMPVKQLKGTYTFSNGHIQLGIKDDNEIASLTSSLTNQSMSFMFTQVFEKAASTIEIPSSVCDGSNVYTYVPNVYKSITTKNSLNTFLTANGPLVWEVNQVISLKTSSCPISTTMRMFKPENNDSFYSYFYEVQNTIGPLEEYFPSSMVFTLNSSLDTQSKFTTYSNGLYPMLRKYDNTKPPQGNYYPLVGRASVEDTQKELGIIVATKRPMAVTSSNEGSLDLLVHRRIRLDNDPRGDDDSIMSDPIHVGTVKSDDINDMSYEAMSRLQSPLIVYTTVVPSIPFWNEVGCTESFGLFKMSLPKGVELLGLEVLKHLSDSQYMIGIRFVNINKSEVTISLPGMFKYMHYITASETSPDYGMVLQHLIPDGKLKLSPYKLATAIVTLNIIV